MLKRVIMLLLVTSWLCGAQVRIALAANMSYAITPLIEAFKQTHPQTDVVYTVGGSGKLAAQILHGAPFDLFLSANMKYPQVLYEKGVAVAPPSVYARGALALLSRKERDLSKGVAVLRSEEIHKIAIANPRTAPYGKAALEALAHAGLEEALREKFVYGESIAQTVAYATHAADAGIIALSALFAPQMRHWKKGLQWVEVDPSLYRPIDQGEIRLKRTADKKEAADFEAFLYSEKAQKILKQYGYRL